MQYLKPGELPCTSGDSLAAGTIALQAGISLTGPPGMVYALLEREGLRHGRVVAKDTSIFQQGDFRMVTGSFYF